MLLIILNAGIGFCQESLVEIDTTFFTDGRYEIVDQNELYKVYSGGLPSSGLYLPPKRVYDSAGNLLSQRIYFDNYTKILNLEFTEEGTLTLLHYATFTDQQYSSVFLKGWLNNELVEESIENNVGQLRIIYQPGRSTPKCMESKTVGSRLESPRKVFECSIDSTYWVESDYSLHNQFQVTQLLFNDNGYPNSFGRSLIYYFDIYKSRMAYEQQEPPIYRNERREVKIGKWEFFSLTGRSITNFEEDSLDVDCN